MRNNLVRDRRGSLGMTQVAFAKALGVATSTISVAETSDVVSERLKDMILRTFPLDDDFFKYVEQKKILESYK